MSPHHQQQQQKFTVDQVESAFSKLDIDQDGFIGWEEFRKVAANMSTEEAQRIFDSCDQVGGYDYWTSFYASLYASIIIPFYYQNGDKKISLEEFQSMARMKKN